MKKVVLLLFAMIMFQESYAQTTSYYRHILVNHMTPRMDLKGLYPISSVVAESVAHYKFSYDDKGRVIEIINSHPSVRGEHPLTDLGVYRVQIEYEGNTETRTFFDKENKRTRNLRKVDKEVYIYTQDGFKTGLSYFDLDDNPMESGWNISNYVWTQQDSLVLEERYDIDGEPQVLAPFFTLGKTLIEYGENGLITAQYNVNDQHKPIAHPTGMASYHDVHDKDGNVVLILYRDINGKLINAADGEFATILLIRDHFGNVTESIGIDDVGKEIWRTINQYDKKGNKI